MRPLSRMERSSSSPVTRPTGAARFWSWSACTTCATPIPDASSACGRSCTVSSRSCFPSTCTSATPGIERSSRVIVGSASRVSSAAVRAVDDSASDTIGRSVSLSLRMIGSSSSSGRSARMSEMASRMSCVASGSGFSNTNSIMTKPYPSDAEPIIFFTPLIDAIASSTGSSTSFSTTSGEAPG